MLYPFTGAKEDNELKGMVGGDRVVEVVPNQGGWTVVRSARGEGKVPTSYVTWACCLQQDPWLKQPSPNVAFRYKLQQHKMRFFSNIESLNVQFQMLQNKSRQNLLLIAEIKKSLQSLAGFTLNTVPLTSLPETSDDWFLGSIELDMSHPPVELLVVQDNQQVM